MRSALSWLVAVGVLVRLGASLECCSEGASFWDDLDDPARTPAGGGSHAASKLPRLCPAQAMLGAAGSSFARCAGGALSSLHLLEHVNAARSWQRLLDVKPAARDSKGQYLNHLPAWSSLQLIPAARIRIFYCSPRGWKGHAESKSTLSKVDCAYDVDSFEELPRDWATHMLDYPSAPAGRAALAPRTPTSRPRSARP